MPERRPPVVPRYCSKCGGGTRGVLCATCDKFPDRCTCRRTDRGWLFDDAEREPVAELPDLRAALGLAHEAPPDPTGIDCHERYEGVDE